MSMWCHCATNIYLGTVVVQVSILCHIITVGSSNNLSQSTTSFKHYILASMLSLRPCGKMIKDECLLVCLYRLSPWSGWTGFLPSKYSMIPVYVAHWRRYFRIWLREGSQGLPGKTPCLPRISHRRIDRSTRGRQLPEQTPPGFSPEPL